MIVTIANLVIDGRKISAVIQPASFVIVDQNRQTMSTRLQAKALYICRDKNSYINQKEPVS